MNNNLLEIIRRVENENEENYEIELYDDDDENDYEDW